MRDTPERAGHWTGGNRLDLLENGEEFFPRVFEAIGSARREVIIETFILFEDKVGLALHAAMRAAAQRGVKVDLMIDGFGSPDLSHAYLESLATAGAAAPRARARPRCARKCGPAAAAAGAPGRCARRGRGHARTPRAATRLRPARRARGRASR